MRLILARSVLVASVLALLASVSTDLIFGQAVEFEEPLDEETLLSMSYKEAMDYLDSNRREVSGFRYVLHSFRDPALLALRAQLFASHFVPVFVGCVWLGLWQNRGVCQ